MAEVSAALVGVGYIDATIGELPDTELWPVMYDMDDSGQIDYGDLAFFAAAFGDSVDQSESRFARASDFDSSGVVDYGDLAYFAGNFGRSLGDSRPVTFADNFPEVRLVQLLVAGYPVETIAGHYAVDKPLEILKWR